MNLLDSDKRMIFAPVFIFEIDVSCKHYKHRTVHLVPGLFWIGLTYQLSWISIRIDL